MDLIMTTLTKKDLLEAIEDMPMALLEGIKETVKILKEIKV